MCFSLILDPKLFSEICQSCQSDNTNYCLEKNTSVPYCQFSQGFKSLFVTLCAMRNHLYNLKNVKNTHSAVLLLVNLQPETLLKLTLFHGCFSRFLICTNGTKSRKASHLHYFLIFWKLRFNY